MSTEPNQKQIQGLNSETIPLFNLHKNMKHKSNDHSILHKYSMSWFDVTIITIVCTLNQLIYKSWFVFETFVCIEYKIEFQFLSWSLALIAISAVPTLFCAGFLNGYKCNYLCLFLNTLAMLCAVLNSLLSGSVFNIFILSFLRTFTAQLFWTLGNSIVYHFMQERPNQKQWRKNAATTIFMGGWSFSTILFLITGPLIDQYGFKLTLLMAACVNIGVTVLLFFRVPAISLNDFIEMEQSSNIIGNADVDSCRGCDTKVCSDIKILFRDLLIVLIMCNTLACVTNWGMYYGSFGFWLQDLLQLNAAKLGMYVTISEACAEMISLFSIPVLSRYVSNGTLCIIGGICETSSVILLNVILWNNAEILNLYILSLDIAWMRIGIILWVIFLFYMGHEFLYIALMVNIDIVPKKTHNTAVALYGCFDFLGAFLGQTFVTYVFAKEGMSAMAHMMLMVEVVSVSCLVSLNLILCTRKRREMKKKLSAALAIDEKSRNERESVSKGLFSDLRS